MSAIILRRIEVEAAEQSCSGWFYVHRGVLNVSSDYGSRKVYGVPNTADAEVTAKDHLRDLIGDISQAPLKHSNRARGSA